MKRHFASAVLLIFLSCLAVSLLCRNSRAEKEFSLSDLEGPPRIVNPDVQVPSDFARRLVCLRN